MAILTWDPSRFPITFINESAQLDALVTAIENSSRVAVDTETCSKTVFPDGLWSSLRVISVAVYFGTDSYQSFVIDVKDIDTASLAKAMSTIKVADAWNANFDEQVLELAGCNVQSWRDAMFSDGLLHTGVSGFGRSEVSGFGGWHSLAWATRKYLGFELTGKGTTQTSYDQAGDLSAEQIRYAGVDALVTLKVAMCIDEIVFADGLSVSVDLEQAARPFFLEMTKRGLPFKMEAWHNKVLAEHEIGLASARSELASLTGGSEVTLFGESEDPSWNPASSAQARDALNTWAAEAVKDFTGGRLLTKSDKLDKNALKQIVHPIAEALLRYRNNSKVLSTYGDNLTVAPDGRIHSRYMHGGIISTGRPASSGPNAQNFSPLMKEYFEVVNEVQPDGSIILRVFVHADLSQAELRVIGQESGDVRMRELFRLGGDFHARTAEDMFKVDMEALKESDPTNYSNSRKKAKSVNFGIPYGLGAAALATKLTIEGKLNTSVQEAKDMLNRYKKSYPSVNEWLKARDGYIDSLAKHPGVIDWDMSFKLMELHKLIAPYQDKKSLLAKELTRRLGHPATDLELSMEILNDAELAIRAAAQNQTLDECRAEHVAIVQWVLSFSAPVVLRQDGLPWSFESRNLAGRRRLFTIPMDSSKNSKFEGILTAVMILICSTYEKEQIAELRGEFAALHKLKLPVGINRCADKAKKRANGNNSRSSDTQGCFCSFCKDERTFCIKAFEGSNKHLKYELLQFITQKMGDDAVKTYLLPAALTVEIGRVRNEFRNHPIQSLVADVGLKYCSDLWAVLPKYRNAFPVQAVHDSIVIECDLAQAVELAAEVKQIMEKALATWCPDVPAVADADIRFSLSDKSVVAEKDIENLLAQHDKISVIK
jgi:DNA polymerase-1